MCNLVTSRPKLHELDELCDMLTVKWPGLHTRYHISPTQELLIVRNAAAGGCEGAYVRWGLVPSWSRDLSMAKALYNARCETAAVKPSFRQSFKQRRCLIPVNGFFEWETVGKKKNPHLFALPEDKPFALAGLWDRATIDGAALESCTILTTDANADVRPFNDRMAVILPREHFGGWLAETSETAACEALCAPFPAGILQSRRVRPIVRGAPAGPESLEPPPPEAEEESEPMLF